MREHTEALAPPRALWVPFILGRPFGVPNDAGFQRGVLLAALKLLEREDGPVLEAYPLDAPAGVLTAAPEGLACPVSFPRLQTEGSLPQNLADEVEQLQAWHNVAAAHRARSTLGVTGLSVAQIVHYLQAWLGSGGGAAPARYREDISAGEAL